MENITSNKGSITVFVLISMLFFIMFLIGVYILSTQNQLKQMTLSNKVNSIYSEDANEVYVELNTVNKNNTIVNSPRILDGMKEIIFNENGETIKNGDNGFDLSIWYDYSENEKKWANAKTEDGSMWVWIPRYAYKIIYYTDSNYTQISLTKTIFGKIDIKFLRGVSNVAYDGTECKYATDSNLKQNDYIVHPCFTKSVDGTYKNGEWDKEQEGIWIAKFEAGFAGGNNSVTQLSTGIKYSGTTATSNYYGTIISGTTEMKYPVFMPKTYSYNYINIGDMYNLSKNLNKNGNPYGLVNTTVDTHMMKSSEWGAVAYLSQSIYGRNGTEITINNVNLNNTVNTIYTVTGYAGSTISASENATTQSALDAETSGSYSWEKNKGKLASTTGNLYGVYDMSGGSLEMISGYINNGNSELISYGGTLVFDGGAISTKYKSIYDYNSSSDTSVDNYSMLGNIERRGQSIWETSINAASPYNNSWNNDNSGFPNSSTPFLNYGGYYNNGSSAGIFSFYYSNGSYGNSQGFRAVLSVKTM